MYGLSADVNLDFLANRQLIQVRVGEYQIQLCFDDDVIISVEGKVTVNGNAYDDSRSMSAPLVATLGANILKTTSPGNGDLVINMSNGDAIVIHDSSQQSESYSVTWKDGTIVV